MVAGICSLASRASHPPGSVDPPSDLVSSVFVECLPDNIPAEISSSFPTFPFENRFVPSLSWQMFGFEENAKRRKKDAFCTGHERIVGVKADPFLLQQRQELRLHVTIERLPAALLRSRFHLSRACLGKARLPFLVFSSLVLSLI